jgi:hypothetical protein
MSLFRVKRNFVLEGRKGKGTAFSRATITVKPVRLQPLRGN